MIFPVRLGPSARQALLRALLAAVSVVPLQTLVAQAVPSAPDSACASDLGATNGSGVALTPTISLIDATTKVQTYSGDMHILANHYPKTGCGPDHNRFDVLLNAKYDQKQKLSAAPNITRHYTGRAQELVMLPNAPYHASLTAQLLSDNSLALYLQQSYSLSVGRTFGGDAFLSEINVGGAFAAQHFTTQDTSTRFVAPSVSAQFNWTIPTGQAHGKPRQTPELQLTISGVLGVSSDPRILTGNASFSIPTFFPPLSLTVKAWGDYISNPPSGFLNHWYAVEFGPQFKLGLLAQ